MVEHWTVTPLTQVRFPGAARDFSPGRFSVQTLLRVSVHPRVQLIVCIKICAHVKDPVVHVRVRWIMETLNHPACTVGWVARLCRSWLSQGKSSPNFLWEKSHWDNTVVKSYTKKKKKKRKEKKKERHKKTTFFSTLPRTLLLSYSLPNHPLTYPLFKTTSLSQFFKRMTRYKWYSCVRRHSENSSGLKPITTRTNKRPSVT